MGVASHFRHCFLCLAAVVLLSACVNSSFDDIKRQSLRFVPVGDSYTEGTGIHPKDAWPSVLMQSLRSEGFDVSMPINPAKAGWTTDDVLRAQLRIFEQSEPDLSTLFIGANDLFQQVSVEVFEKNFREIVVRMLAVLPSNNRLILVTIPDYSLTPAGIVYGRGRDIAADLDAYNTVITAVAKENDLVIADVHSTSRDFIFDLSLISEDKLHPSEKGHLLWEKVIRKAILDSLKR